jgi:hypothetical protein
MKLPIIAALSVLVFCVPSLVTAADLECPVQSLAHDDIERAINDAPTCDASLALFQRCGSAASGDVSFGSIVAGKCEAVFAGELSAAQDRAYSRAKTVCSQKYEEEDGTMYRSFEAFCYAQAAHRMAKQFSAKVPATPAK